MSFANRREQAWLVVMCVSGSWQCRRLCAHVMLFECGGKGLPVMHFDFDASHPVPS